MKYCILLILIFSFNVIAVEPDEILEDADLEKIAKEIGSELRCLVCQNEDIQNSNADIAKDLRVLVRKKLTEGKSKDEIIKYVHSRYGDFVLFSPPVRPDTVGLWILPTLFFLILSFFFFRKKT